MLFVDHDELQMRHRRKHRHACAQHNARLAVMRRQPILQTLRGREVAVHGDHAIVAPLRRKALAKARLQLRCEVDFGHHHQDLRGCVFR